MMRKKIFQKKNSDWEKPHTFEGNARFAQEDSGVPLMITRFRVEGLSSYPASSIHSSFIHSPFIHSPFIHSSSHWASSSLMPALCQALAAEWTRQTEILPSWSWWSSSGDGHLFNYNYIFIEQHDRCRGRGPLTQHCLIWWVSEFLAHLGGCGRWGHMGTSQG